MIDGVLQPELLRIEFKLEAKTPCLRLIQEREALESIQHLGSRARTLPPLR